MKRLIIFSIVINLISCVSKSEKLDSITLSKKAHLAIQNSKIDSGIYYLENLIILEPRKPNNYIQLAYLFGLKDDLINQKKTLWKAISKCGEKYTLYTQLGLSYEISGKIDSSKLLYQNAIKIISSEPKYSNDCNVEFEKLLLLGITDDMESAIAEFESSFENCKNIKHYDELSFIKWYLNEMKSYQGGGYLELVETNPLLDTLLVKNQIENLGDSLLDLGINCYTIIGNKVVMKPKFTDKALKTKFIKTAANNG